MALNDEHIQGLAEMESCTKRYFEARILPIMKSVETKLTDKQNKELIEYSTSMEGILNSLGSGTGHTANQSLDYLKIKGEWNSKTTEDYLTMCREEITNTEKIASELNVLVKEWKEELTSAIGSEKYERASKRLDRDLAEAYLDFRLEQQMIDKLVKDETPKSTAEYILRKAANNSLFGINTQINKTALDKTISDKANKSYSASEMEKTAGNLIGFGIDSMVTGGMGSWGRLVAMAAIDIGANTILDEKVSEEDILENTETTISKGVFGYDTNFLKELRERGTSVFPHENERIRRIDEEMGGGMKLIPEENLKWMDKTFERHNWKMHNERENARNTTDEIPAIIIPGKEREYMELQKQETNEKHNMQNNKTENLVNNENEVILDEEYPTRGNEENPYSWGGLLKSTGMNGMGGIWNNLGYVIAMLPDMLGGMITGKTKSLKFSDNLLPLASILCGMFVKNPLLRMLLVGGGGLNLLNKAGNDALEKNDEQRTVRYKTYNDENLDTRIENPQIKGNYLFMNIDKVPCSVRLPPQTAEAYHSGAVPINTLANAILRKSDELQSKAMENYERSESEKENKGLTIG